MATEGAPSAFDSLIDLLEQLYELLFYITAALDLTMPLMTFSGFLIAALVAAIVSFVVSVIFYVLEAVPVYAVAKKCGRKSALLAWVPIFGDHFRTYVIADIAADKPFTLFNGKLTFKSRKSVYWVRLLVSVFGTALVSAVTMLLQTVASIVPVAGWTLALILTALPLLPSIFCAFVDYVFLRDVLDMYNQDEKANVTAASIVSVADYILPYRIARTFYLYTLIKKKPIK